jgi:hypothetical protein
LSSTTDVAALAALPAVDGLPPDAAVHPAAIDWGAGGGSAAASTGAAATTGMLAAGGERTATDSTGSVIVSAARGRGAMQMSHMGSVMTAHNMDRV